VTASEWRHLTEHDLDAVLAVHSRAKRLRWQRACLSWCCCGLLDARGGCNSAAAARRYRWLPQPEPVCPRHMLPFAYRFALTWGWPPARHRSIFGLPLVSAHSRVALVEGVIATVIDLTYTARARLPAAHLAICAYNCATAVKGWGTRLHSVAHRDPCRLLRSGPS